MSAPTLTTTTTAPGKMNDPNDSGDQSSSVDTPSTSQMDSFDFMGDPSDTLAFLMAASSSDHSGDSSTEESYRGTSTPPSSHGSPMCSAALPAAKPVDSSAFSFLNQQDFGGLEYPTELGDDLSGMDFSFLNSAIYSNNALDYPIEGQSVSHFIPGAPAFDKSPYTFNFSQAAAATPGSQPHNRLLKPPRNLNDFSSNASSASSSASSPLMNHNLPAGTAPLPEANNAQVSGNPTIDSLAQRARQMVGVTMALPTAGESHEQPKVPIPRLQRPPPQIPPAPKRKQAASAPAAPAASNPPFLASSAPAPAQRTKTAHTTIERRYRTNINARIQSLRAAVPALRVLEQREGNRIGNLNIKGDAVDVIDERGYVDGVKVARKGSKANVLGKAVEYINVLKRRELRLTREKEGLRSLICSLVGGPALLKEWEGMWVEQFGGPEMDEVESGEQADDENDDDDEDAEEDDEDGLASKKRKRSTADSSNVKAKSGLKTSSVSPPAPIVSAPAFSVIAPGQPEKRKRGRPRKQPLPSPASIDTPQSSIGGTPDQTSANMDLDALYNHPALASIPGAEQLLVQQAQVQMAQYQHVQPGQYLLAAFAFFSFFNSPFAYYASSTSRNGRPHHGETHAHSGVVLEDRDHGYSSSDWMAIRRPGEYFGWRDIVQVFHVAVSLLLLLSVVGPLLPKAFRRQYARAMPRAFRPFLGLPHTQSAVPNLSRRDSGNDGRQTPSESSEDERVDASARTSLSTALNCKGTSVQQEIKILREAIGLRPGILGLVSSVLRATLSRTPHFHRLERRVLEQKAFARLAELIAMDVTASTYDRIQTYLYASNFISASSASAADLATLALVVQPLWETKAVALWDQALARIHRQTGGSFRVTKPYEALVLESMTVDDAMERIRLLDARELRSRIDRSTDADSSDFEDEHSSSGPLATLARQVVFEFIRSQAEGKFVQLALDVDVGEPDSLLKDLSNANSAKREEKSGQIIAAGMALDRRSAELVQLYCRTCEMDASTPTTSGFDEESSDEEWEGGARSADEQEITSLLQSILLYQQFFPSLLLKGQATQFSDSEYGASQPPRAQPPVSISLTPMPSPPPSPSMQVLDSTSHASLKYLNLRRRLASSAFDRSDILEDARDHVVEALESCSFRSI